MSSPMLPSLILLHGDKVLEASQEAEIGDKAARRQGGKAAEDWGNGRD